MMALEVIQLTLPLKGMSCFLSHSMGSINQGRTGSSPALLFCILSLFRLELLIKIISVNRN